MDTSRRTFLKTLAAGSALGALHHPAEAAAPPQGADVTSWPKDADRVWVGPAFWANRLQDWRLRDGWLECAAAADSLPMRAVHLLTRRLGTDPRPFEVSVRAQRIDPEEDAPAADAAFGFLLGAGGATMDYRGAALIHAVPGPGGGLFAGFDAGGRAFARSFEKPQAAKRGKAKPDAPREVLLRVVGEPNGDGYRLTVIATDPASNQELARAEQQVPAGRLVGNIALVSHPGTGAGAARFRFRDWLVFGPGIERHDDRAVGPIFCTQYTVHNKVLKLTAQMQPIGANDAQEATLQLRGGGAWKTAATAKIIAPGYTATFRVEGWDDTRDVAYRVVYPLKGKEGTAAEHHFGGIIKRDPKEKKTIVLGALSCVQQINGSIRPKAKSYGWNRTVWFPHADMVPNLLKHKPDLLFFAGDQIYEGNPTPAVRRPVEEANLDYLYKWFLWCWTYRDVTKDFPCVTIPDDHDVYQGNIWGDAGNPPPEDDLVGLGGGYGMPPGWLNMMQRTQTSHLPDPIDPAPAEQGIGVYFTALVWGGIGFAILEDRKFKSPPRVVKAPMTRDSHITDPNFDTRKADLPGLRLLGERQEKFLRRFAQDWKGQEMKAALSQTIFCNLQISSRPPTTGQLDRDLDSNGWPQTPRNRALREMRSGFMVHIAGDQHLPSVVHQGTDDWEDAVVSFCVPAVSNLYIRFWNPDYPPQNPGGRPPPGTYLGRYEDGFHNKMTVLAVANPVNNPKPGQFPEPVELHRKSPGYGIVRFDKEKRIITLECWPRYADPADPRTGGQYAGWPIEVPQEASGGRVVARLPLLRVKGAADPVVQVIDETTGEVVHTLRIKGNEHRPRVFTEGRYTIKVGEPGSDRVKTVEHVRTVGEDDTRVIEVEV